MDQRLEGSLVEGSNELQQTVKRVVLDDLEKYKICFPHVNRLIEISGYFDILDIAR